MLFLWYKIPFIGFKNDMKKWKILLRIEEKNQIEKPN